VEDDCLVVEASNGDVQNDFVSRIQLPPEVEAEKLTSSLSADGILTVQAPCPPRYEKMVSGASQSLPGVMAPPSNTLHQTTSKQLANNQVDAVIIIIVIINVKHHENTIRIGPLPHYRTVGQFPVVKNDIWLYGILLFPLAGCPSWRQIMPVLMCSSPCETQGFYSARCTR